MLCNALDKRHAGSFPVYHEDMLATGPFGDMRGLHVEHASPLSFPVILPEAARRDSSVLKSGSLVPGASALHRKEFMVS